RVEKLRRGPLRSARPKRCEGHVPDARSWNRVWGAISQFRAATERNPKRQTPSSRQVPESKHQKPSSKHQRNPKFQAPNLGPRFELGTWSLELLWCLELGVWWLGPGASLELGVWNLELVAWDPV